MERENVQLVDDNCSQMEVAFKRMKVTTTTTRRCTEVKNHRHIYNRSNHYQHSPQSNHHQDDHTHKKNQQQQQQPNQIVQHPDLQSNTNRVSSTTTRVNPYHNQMFNTSTRVIPSTPDDDTVDRLVSMDGKDSISFSSFSSTPLALINNFPSSSTNTAPSSSSSSPLVTSLSAVTPPHDSCNFMGPYRDVVLCEGQIDTSHHRNHLNHHQNQMQNDNNHHHHQSNDHTKYEDGPPADPDVSVEELAAYLDVQLYIPRKMSYMAELMYT